MKRNFSDWLHAYIECVAHTEAPRRLHFWTGVSTIAGALRRRVWCDMKSFRWIPNFYIVIVAPPGIVGKSTTLDIGHDLLREVPGIHFGPNIVTWQALIPAFSAVAEQFECNGVFLEESALTCTVSELGNLLDPKERQLIDLLVTLWDNRKNLDKSTKMNGEDHLVNPWINIEACVTPAWLQANISAATVGGGLASRILFIYADTKDRYVAYVDENLPKDYDIRRKLLIEDLTYISGLRGAFSIPEPARRWGRLWYEKLWENYNDREDSFGNYIARKQTHLHKLAMVISVSQRDDLTITAEDYATADKMLVDVEVDMPKVFARMGKSEASVQSDRLVAYITRRGAVGYEEAYRYVHSNFPDFHDYEGILAGAIRSGIIQQVQQGSALVLVRGAA